MWEIYTQWWSAWYISPTSIITSKKSRARRRHVESKAGATISPSSLRLAQRCNSKGIHYGTYLARPLSPRHTSRYQRRSGQVRLAGGDVRRKLLALRAERGLHQHGREADLRRAG